MYPLKAFLWDGMDVVVDLNANFCRPTRPFANFAMEAPKNTPVSKLLSVGCLGPNSQSSSKKTTDSSLVVVTLPAMSGALILQRPGGPFNKTRDHWDQWSRVVLKGPPGCCDELVCFSIIFLTVC